MDYDAPQINRAALSSFRFQLTLKLRRMKKACIAFCFIMAFMLPAGAQAPATVRLYKKTFTTYPFSDPDPIPRVGRIYPYFRYDGYASKPVQKEWQVVELSNDYLTVMVLPEIGGKVWAAIEKKSGKSFVYYNHVVKFRDIAMRGPWTSGGIEPNYGIIGHTPNCATPVDYTTLTKEDGSVSCVVGVLDLLTRTSWRLDINLPKDKAYITTTSLWHNSTPLEQPYYTWMNTGLPAKGNTEFIYPGSKYLGHAGEFAAWPQHEQNGKKINWYEQNNFGGYKSYHVWGRYTDFFGAYWHDDDFGMVRYGAYGDKPGKKIWIWGLSQQGMIWEKLLSDTDGQYVEVQSGRMFNQAAEQSTFTPFKHIGFAPASTDTWTEYWYPVAGTKGFVAASPAGALNLSRQHGQLQIAFSPVSPIDDTLTIRVGTTTIYQKKISGKPLSLILDSIAFNGDISALQASIGQHRLQYDANPESNLLHRPVEGPKDFNWNSAYGLYLQGKEAAHQRDYGLAMEKINASLAIDPNLLPALAQQTGLLLRNRRYDDALAAARRALSIDTYDPEANYYYGLVNEHKGLIADAKDGFEIAALNPSWRSAASTQRSRLAFKESDFIKASVYAQVALDMNKFNLSAKWMLAVAHRLQGNKATAENIIDTILQWDPLHHLAYFERYLMQPTAATKNAFTQKISNELPHETYLELAIAYHNLGQDAEAQTLLAWSPQNAETAYWQAYLSKQPLDTAKLNPHLVFPFRTETADVLEQLIPHNNHWMLQYHLGLIAWHLQDTATAKSLFAACGNRPRYVPFYAARAELNKQDEELFLKDIRQAAGLDPTGWRYGQIMAANFLKKQAADKALAITTAYFKKHPANYIIGMQHVKALMQKSNYKAAADLLDRLEILPYEGATDGRQLFKETHLMLAVQMLRQGAHGKALEQVEKARQWPERLGAGKPYDADNDERLEDWIAYRVYKAMGAKEKGAGMLEKILNFSNQQAASGNLDTRANSLITAWALKEQGKPAEAIDYLQGMEQKEPQNNLVQWALSAFQGKEAATAVQNGDENYRVLQQLLP